MGDTGMIPALGELGSKTNSADRPETGRGAIDLRELIFFDSDIRRAEILAEAIREHGYRVSISETLSEALKYLKDSSAAVLDYGSLGRQAAREIRSIRALCPDVRILILSHTASLSGAVMCIKAGADEFLTHPASAEEIEAFIRADKTPTQLPRVTSLADATRLHAHATLRSVENSIPAAARLLKIRAVTLRRLLDLP